MSLNCQSGKDHQLKASANLNVLDCFYQCWDLQKHQVCTNLAWAESRVWANAKPQFFFPVFALYFFSSTFVMTRQTDIYSAFQRLYVLQVSSCIRLCINLWSLQTRVAKKYIPLYLTAFEWCALTHKISKSIPAK